MEKRRKGEMEKRRKGEMEKRRKGEMEKWRRRGGIGFAVILNEVKNLVPRSAVA